MGSYKQCLGDKLHKTLQTREEDKTMQTYRTKNERNAKKNMGGHFRGRICGRQECMDEGGWLKVGR